MNAFVSSAFDMVGDEGVKLYRSVLFSKLNLLFRQILTGR